MTVEFTRLGAAGLDSGSAYRGERPLRVVVGWNTSGDDGIALASWLGKSLPVEVSVISAAPRTWTKQLSQKKYARWLRQETEKFTSAATRAMEEHLNRSQVAERACTLVDAADEPSALVSAAQELGADIILLGSGAKLKKARFLASSPADALLRGSPVPLGLAPKGLKLSKKGVTRVNFVFLYADREQNTIGLVHAVMLAALLGVPLRIVSVIPELPQEDKFDADIDILAESPDWYEASLALLDLARDESYRAVSELRGADAAEALEIETALAHGSGWKKAVNSVKWKRGDLICLGSRSKAEDNRIYVGSRATSLLRFAPAPVVIYPRIEA